MADIVERLRGLADVFEAQQATHNLVLHMRAGADEIERLRTRLEIDPSHPYDGIYCRDETIRGLEKEIARLRSGGCARDQGTTQYCAEAAKKDTEIQKLLTLLADARTESMRLRAALEQIAKSPVYDGCQCRECAHSAIARAALEGK